MADELWPAPDPTHVQCRRCHHPVRRGRDVDGYGEDCAALLGLITAAPRLRTDAQTGLSLLDLLDPNHEPEDHCDGYDR